MSKHIDPENIVALGIESRDRVATSGGLGIDLVRCVLSDQEPETVPEPPKAGVAGFISGTPTYYADMKDGSRATLTRAEYDSLRAALFDEVARVDDV